MEDTLPSLPEPVNRFIAARRERGDVSAVLPYGSYARGTPHEQSDVDIIFIVDEGFKSELVEFEGMDFEVLEETKLNMFAFWETNLDEDRHWYLWKDVKVLYDRDGEGAEAVAHALSLVGEKKPWPEERIEMRKQVAQAKLRRTRSLSQHDPGTAAIVLVELVQESTAHWFDARGRRVPSSKGLLAVFAQEHPELGDVLVDFYTRSAGLEPWFDLVERLVDFVYAAEAQPIGFVS